MDRLSLWHSSRQTLLPSGTTLNYGFSNLLSFLCLSFGVRFTLYTREDARRTMPHASEQTRTRREGRETDQLSRFISTECRKTTTHRALYTVRFSHLVLNSLAPASFLLYYRFLIFFLSHLIYLLFTLKVIFSRLYGLRINSGKT